MERLDKFLCDSGVGTRSQVKVILKAGRVQVDGKVEKDNSRKVDPNTQTITLDGEVLGKPSDAKEACSMLAKLSGQTHQVITGVTLRTLDRTHTFSSVTEVSFADLTKEQIEYYVKNYAPFDKAGAYGIQEWIGCVGVTSINGSYYNVMGLPVQRLDQELNAFLNEETDSFVDNFIY